MLDEGDPALDPFRSLTDAQWRRAGHGPFTAGRGPFAAEHGLFIAESLHVVQRVLQLCGDAVRAVVVTPHAEARLGAWLERSAGPVLVVAPELLAAVAGFDVHRGVLAAVARPEPRRAEELLASARRIAVLEDLTDQVNLGALFRSASALGIDAVLLSPRCADPLYRRTVRVSMGEVLRLPYATIAPWPDGLALLATHGFELVALSPAGDKAMRPPPSSARVAVLLGSEADGVSPGALAAADRSVRIAMVAGVDSLNVAAAGAIAFATYGLVDAAGGGPGDGGPGGGGPE